MRKLLVLCTLAGLACAGHAGEAPPTFTRKPIASRINGPSTGSGQGKVRITFTVSAPTDVEVAILDAKDKVVRHLAAGVLGGKNPPPPPLKPGLSQNIVWDGKGDWNLPIGKGPFKVRVRAGMGVNLGGFVGDSPYNFYETVCWGMAVDPKNGDLYFLGRRGRGAAILFLRVYERSGKYLREIMPYPASLDARSRTVYGAVSVPGTDVPVPLNQMSTWPTPYPMVSKAAARKVRPKGITVRLIGPHPAEKGTLAIVDGYGHSLYRIRTGDGGVPEGRPFEEPLWPRDTKPLTGYAVNYYETTGAFSADGKRFYLTSFSGYAPSGKKLHPDWPEGRIYLKTGDGKMKRFADVLPPAGAPVPKAGSSSRTAQNIHGLAVDSRGNVLVCDAACARIRIFSPKGKQIGEVATPANPYALALNERNGVLYVVTRRKVNNSLRAGSLVKISGWNPAAPQGKTAVAATLPFLGRFTAGRPFIALDTTGKIPQVWVSGGARSQSLLRIEDRGGELEVLEDLADRGKTAAAFAVRMDVDAEKDLVYIANSYGHIRRYDGTTGKYAGKLGKDGLPEPITGSEFCIRRDGTIYVSGADRSGGYSGKAWNKFKRDLTPYGKGVPLWRYGKKGNGYYGNSGSCVTPDGRLFYNALFNWRSNAIFEITPDGKPGRMPRMQDTFVGSLSPESKKYYEASGIKGVLIGPLQDQSGGVEVDQEGYIYCGINVLPKGYKLPGEMDKHKIFRGSIGSVVKFKPSGGALWPEGVKPGSTYKPAITKSVVKVPDRLEDGLHMGRAQKLKETFLEGAVAAYPGLAPFSGFEKGQGHCACQTPRFDVDDYGRLILPNAMTCSVKVIDNNGNEILRFGGYGNHDDGLRNEGTSATNPGNGSSKSEVRNPKSAIPLGYPCAAKSSFKHIYVADSANRRVARVDPIWAAEETCEVR
jgi:hypothetical protein